MATTIIFSLKAEGEREMEDIFYIIGVDRAGHTNEMEFTHLKNRGITDVCESGTKGATVFNTYRDAIEALGIANASYLRHLYTFEIVSK